MKVNILLLGLLFAPFGAQAQFAEHLKFGDMIGMSEGQIKAKMPKFHITERRDNNHEPGTVILLFQDTLKKVSVSFTFFVTSLCYQVWIKAPKKDLPEYVRLANLIYKEPGERNHLLVDEYVFSDPTKKIQLSIFDYSTYRDRPEDAVVSLFSRISPH